MTNLVYPSHHHVMYSSAEHPPIDLTAPGSSEEIAQIWNALAADNDRLRGLIKRVERGGDSTDGSFCPWCQRWDEHRRSCAAFTTEGVVK